VGDGGGSHFPLNLTLIVKYLPSVDARYLTIILR